MLWMIWWFWAAVGIGLAILEVLAPGYIFLGFAIGSVVVSGLLWFGFGASLPWLLVICAAVALGSWLVLRRVFGIRKGQVKVIRHDINEDLAGGRRPPPDVQNLAVIKAEMLPSRHGTFTWLTILPSFIRQGPHQLSPMALAKAS